MEGIFELLLVIAEIFLEVFIETAGAVLLDPVLRALTRIFPKSSASPETAAAGYTCFGLLAGVLSIVIVPHPLVRASKFHGMIVLVSPLITGLIMALVGSVVRRRGKRITQIESFAYGFSFAFGMALIRYFFLHRA
jgi:hypothetical protein